MSTVALFPITVLLVLSVAAIVGIGLAVELNVQGPIPAHPLTPQQQAELNQLEVGCYGPILAVALITGIASVIIGVIVFFPRCYSAVFQRRRGAKNEAN